MEHETLVKPKKTELVVGVSYIVIIHPFLTNHVDLKAPTVVDFRLPQRYSLSVQFLASPHALHSQFLHCRSMNLDRLGDISVVRAALRQPWLGGICGPFIRSNSLRPVLDHYSS